MSLIKANECFKILNLEKNFPITQDQIKSAYKAQAKILHPDNKETGDTEKFKQLNESYEFLKDNIDRINEVNLREKEKEKQKKNDNFYIFQATDSFIKAYKEEIDDKRKLELINSYAIYIEKMNQKNPTEEYIRNLFKSKMNGF